MSSISVITTAPGGDIGDLARAVQWARLLVDAAIPAACKCGNPECREAVLAADLAGFRAEAFRQVLAELIEGGWQARLSDLGRLTEGRMPEPRP